MSPTRLFYFALSFVFALTSVLAQEMTKVVEAVTLKPTDVIQSATFLAELKAKHTTHLVAEVQGVVEKIHVKAGMAVKSGTVLAQLKSAELSARFKAADEAEDLAKTHFERCQQLRRCCKNLSSYALKWKVRRV